MPAVLKTARIFLTFSPHSILPPPAFLRAALGELLSPFLQASQPQFKPSHLSHAPGVVGGGGGGEPLPPRTTIRRPSMCAHTRSSRGKQRASPGHSPQSLPWGGGRHGPGIDPCTRRPRANPRHKRTPGAPSSSSFGHLPAGCITKNVMPDARARPGQAGPPAARLASVGGHRQAAFLSSFPPSARPGPTSRILRAKCPRRAGGRAGQGRQRLCLFLGAAAAAAAAQHRARELARLGSARPPPRLLSSTSTSLSLSIPSSSSSRQLGGLPKAGRTAGRGGRVRREPSCLQFALPGCLWLAPPRSRSPSPASDGGRARVGLLLVVVTGERRQAAGGGGGCSARLGSALPLAFYLPAGASLQRRLQAALQASRLPGARAFFGRAAAGREAGKRFFVASPTSWPAI